jgi:hypothetical protein
VSLAQFVKPRQEVILDGLHEKIDSVISDLTPKSDVDSHLLCLASRLNQPVRSIFLQLMEDILILVDWTFRLQQNCQTWNDAAICKTIQREEEGWKSENDRD